MKKILSNNWIVSILVNIIILALIVTLTDVMYETNDDYAIACRIADGYPYVNFINYYLCILLIPLQKVITGLNVYILVQMVVAFAAFIFILKTILDRSKTPVISLVSALVLMVFAADHYSSMQYTKTSAILIIAGMLVLIDSMISQKKWYYYLYALLFMYLGVAFRVDSLIAVIGFGGIFLIFWVIWNRKNLISDGYLSGRKIVLYIVLLAFIGGCYGFQTATDQANVSTPELSKYKAYSELRSDIVDYPVYEYYEGNETEYDAIGISENDLYLIDHWYFDYEGAAKAENLEKILDVDSHVDKEGKSLSASVKTFIKTAVHEIRSMSFTGIHMLLLILLAIWSAFMLKPKHWLYILAVGIFAVMLYIALFYMGRPAYRAMYVADAGAAIWLLYYTAVFNDRGCCSRGTTAACIIMALATALLMMPTLADCNKAYNMIDSKVMPEEAAQYIEQNEDKLFVFPVSEKKFASDYTTPLKVPGKAGLDNVMGTGSWGTMSPYILNKLNNYGLNNPIKGLINCDNAYFVSGKSTDRLMEYYNKWYGNDGKITLDCVKEIDGYNILKVVKTKESAIVPLS